MPYELAVFYELVERANKANGRLVTIDVLSNEQLQEPASLEIFQHRHLVIEGVPFQMHKFNSSSLGRLFGTSTKLPFIGG
jgi:hypothetical protein